MINCIQIANILDYACNFNLKKTVFECLLIFAFVLQIVGAHCKEVMSGVQFAVVDTSQVIKAHSRMLFQHVPNLSIASTQNENRKRIMKIVGPHHDYL